LFLDDNLSSEGAHGLKTSPEKSADRKIRVLRNSCGDHAVLLACHASLFSGVSGGYMEMIRTTFVPEASELDVCRIFQTSLMSSGLGTDGFTKGALFGFEDRATQEALVRLLVARYGVDHAQKVIAHRAKVEETPIDKCSTANSSILPHLLEAIYEPTAFVRRAQLLAQNALRNELRAADVRHWWYLCEYYAELPAMANFKANLLALSGMFDSLI
jgi:hypothetical protein